MGVKFDIKYLLQILLLLVSISSSPAFANTCSSPIVLEDALKRTRTTYLNHERTDYKSYKIDEILLDKYRASIILSWEQVGVTFLLNNKYELYIIAGCYQHGGNCGFPEPSQFGSPIETIIENERGDLEFYTSKLPEIPPPGAIKWARKQSHCGLGTVEKPFQFQQIKHGRADHSLIRDYNFGSILIETGKQKQGIELIVSSCKNGNVVVCYEALDFFGYDGINKDRKKFLELSRYLCENRIWAEACFEYGSKLMEVEGSATKKMAYKATLFGCEQNHRMSCQGVAELASMGWGVKRSSKKERLYFGKACQMGAAPACRQYYKMQLAGKGGRKDKNSAISSLYRACNLGSWLSCMDIDEKYAEYSEPAGGE